MKHQKIYAKPNRSVIIESLKRSIRLYNDDPYSTSNLIGILKSLLALETKGSIMAQYLVADIPEGTYLPNELKRTDWGFLCTDKKAHIELDAPLRPRSVNVKEVFKAIETGLLSGLSICIGGGLYRLTANTLESLRSFASDTNIQSSGSNENNGLGREVHDEEIPCYESLYLQHMNFFSNNYYRLFKGLEDIERAIEAYRRETTTDTFLAVLKVIKKLRDSGKYLLVISPYYYDNRGSDSSILKEPLDAGLFAGSVKVSTDDDCKSWMSGEASSSIIQAFTNPDQYIMSSCSDDTPLRCCTIETILNHIFDKPGAVVTINPCDHKQCFSINQHMTRYFID